MHKLQKPAPAWHAKVIAEIEREFAETDELTETARRRRARLGMMLIWIKAAGKADGSIPHGEFGPWMKKNLPAIPMPTAGSYITEAHSIFDLLGWQISGIQKFETPPHKLLLAKPEVLSPEDKANQKELLKIIDQKSHFQAVTQYKQVEMKDDATVPKSGRRVGEGAAPVPTDALEKLDYRRKLAIKRASKIYNLLDKLGPEIMALSDEEVELLLATLERQCAACQAWLNQPKGKRDAAPVVKAWKGK